MKPRNDKKRHEKQTLHKARLNVEKNFKHQNIGSCLHHNLTTVRGLCTSDVYQMTNNFAKYNSFTVSLRSDCCAILVVQI